MNRLNYAEIQGFEDQRYRIAPPGVMGPYAINWDAPDPDSGNEPSEDTERYRPSQRRSDGIPCYRNAEKGKTGKPRKRKVMLTISGHKVPAYYWAP